jgi:hypothetical protein
MLYIEEIISNSMKQKLSRKGIKKQRIFGFPFESRILGKSRDETPLSTGEQNFLSLTFEFLKAKIRLAYCRNR